MGKLSSLYPDAEAVEEALNRANQAEIDIISINQRLAAINATLDGKASLSEVEAARVSGASGTVYNDLESRINAVENYITPEMYGAVGNGTADDTEALQLAINSASGKQIVLSKTYQISSPLKLVNGTRMTGYGINAHLVSSEDITLFTHPDTNKIENVVIENLKLTKKSGTARHAEFIDAVRLHFVNCDFRVSGEVLTAHKNGVKFVRASVSFLNRLENCQLSHCKIVMGSTDSYLINNRIWADGIDDYALQVVASSQFITENQIVGGLKGAVWLQQVDEVMFVNNFIDGSYADIHSGNGITITEGVQGNVISHNWIYNQSGSGIMLDGALQVVITENIFNNNHKHKEGIADIVLDYDTYNYYGIIANNTFYNNRAIDVQKPYYAIYQDYEEDTEKIARFKIDGNIISPQGNGYTKGNALTYCHLAKSHIFGNNQAKAYNYNRIGDNVYTICFSCKSSGGDNLGFICDNAYSTPLDANTFTAELDDGTEIGGSLVQIGNKWFLRNGVPEYAGRVAILTINRAG